MGVVFSSSQLVSAAVTRVTEFANHSVTRVTESANHSNKQQKKKGEGIATN